MEYQYFIQKIDIVHFIHRANNLFKGFCIEPKKVSFSSDPFQTCSLNKKKWDEQIFRFLLNETNFSEKINPSNFFSHEYLTFDSEKFIDQQLYEQVWP